MSQMALPLDWTRTRDSGSGFLVSASNAEAVKHLEHSATWPVRVSVLVGPPQSGKSLLGRLFAEATGAEIIDTVHDRHDNDLFHAWNRAQEKQLPLLMIANIPPSQWKVELADLKSRLAAAPVVTIFDPDDGLAAALIERLFADRGTRIADDLPAYLVPRIERSYANIHQIVMQLDEAALAQRKRISVPFARQFLQDESALSLPGFDPL